MSKKANKVKTPNKKQILEALQNLEAQDDPSATRFKALPKWAASLSKKLDDTLDTANSTFGQNYNAHEVIGKINFDVSSIREKLSKSQTGKDVETLIGMVKRLDANLEHVSGKQADAVEEISADINTIVKVLSESYATPFQIEEQITERLKAVHNTPPVWAATMTTNFERLYREVELLKVSGEAHHDRIIDKFKIIDPMLYAYHARIKKLPGYWTNMLAAMAGCASFVILIVVIAVVVFLANNYLG